MALALLKNPGTMGADVVVGTTQLRRADGYGGTRGFLCRQRIV